MDSLKKSFKSNGSYKHIVRKSTGDLEEQPILFDHEDGAKNKEFVVKIDGGGGRDVELVEEPNNKKWRESSYDFWKDSAPATDMEGSLGVKNPYLSGHQRTFSKELKVSFQDPSNQREEMATEPVRSPSQCSSDEDDEDAYDQIGRGDLKCTSNLSFQRRSSLLRTKTKSRLVDPPPNSNNGERGDEGRSGRVMKSGQLKSGQLKSGMLGKIKDEDDEDPFMDEDIPDELTRGNMNLMTVLQWVSLIVILTALICTLLIPSLKNRLVWNLYWWKWEIFVLVLICGRLVSGWGIRIVVFFIERNFLLRKRVLYFVYGVRKAVQNCLWLGLVLIAWNFIVDEDVEGETKSKILPYVTKVLMCLLVATLLRLIKTLLVKVLASSFHVSTYFDRIQDSLFNQYVIETLSGPPSVEIQNTREEEERVMAELQKLQNAGANIPADLREASLPSKSKRVIGSSGFQRSPQIGKSVRFSPSTRQQDDGITIDHLHKLNQKNISAWNMKRLINIVRHGVLSTLDEQIPDATQEEDSAMQIRSEVEAKSAAKKIFQQCGEAWSKVRYIYLVDLMRFMKEDEALKTMSLFEGAEKNDRVNKSSLKNWVVNAFRERRALSLTLNDTKTAVNKLHHMINMVVGIVVVVIWLLILGIATTHLLVFISSQLLLVVFIFGNTCKMIFEAIIFLFVMHPFDVGDRCEVDGVQMIVEEMNILTTVFLRYDNQKITYPNTVLATLPISNYYRSPDMGDAIEFCIHVSTPVEKVAIMKQRIKGYIESKKEHWYPTPNVVVKDVEDLNRLKMAVWLQHRMNHQDMGERWIRRAHVVEEMVKIFRELDVEYRMLPLDINVRNLPALSSSRLPSTWLSCN